MKAGRYYIGDLCYVLDGDKDHSIWDEVCDITFDVCGNSIDGEHQLKDGRKFGMCRTMYGDGCYHSNTGVEHGVDSGTIGCILVDDIPLQNRNELDMQRCGNIVVFDKDFEVYRTNDGRIVFGSYVVYTGDDDDYDEDWDIDDEDWDDDDDDDTD